MVSRANVELLHLISRDAALCGCRELTAAGQAVRYGDEQRSAIAIRETKLAAGRAAHLDEPQAIVEKQDGQPERLHEALEGRLLEWRILAQARGRRALSLLYERQALDAYRLRPQVALRRTFEAVFGKDLCMVERQQQPS